MARPEGAVRLRVVPCGVSEARLGVRRWHRHLAPPVGAMAAFAVEGPGRWPVGYCLIGRPVARALQERGWVELTRSATDGTPNATSALLGAASRWAREKGAPIVTYTLACESGASLRGAGWVCVGSVRAAQWTCASRPRPLRSGVVAGEKLRWMPAWCASQWVDR